MTGTAQSCECEKCQKACTYVPGWFKPEEIAPLAKAMKLTMRQLFEKYLRIEFWTRSADAGGDIYIIAPTVTHAAPGEMAESDPRGTCVFLIDGKCSIHELGKPFECAFYIHGMSSDEVSASHKALAMAWDKPEHQKFVEEVAGFEPYTPDIDPFAFLFG